MTDMRYQFKNKRVLLVDGSARQVLPLAKSLRSKKCYVATYNGSKFDVGYSSRYPDKRVLGYCIQDDKDKTYECLKEEIQNGQYDVVIPTNDFVATILSQNKPELSKYAFISVVDWDTFVLSIDKLKTMRICMENNIPCPRTVLESDIEELGKYEFQFPVVVKPRTSYAGIGFSTVNSYEELRNAFAAVCNRFGGALCQEYIPQTMKQYNAQLFVDKYGAVKSSIVYTKVRWFPLSGGSSTLNVTVDRPDILETCESFLKKINWRGYAEIELIDDPRDGIAKLMEINPRLSGSVKICYMAGVDFSRQFLEDALDMEVTSFLPYKKNVYLRFYHKDILWFLKSNDRFKAEPSWFSHLFVPDQIFSWDDPLPFFAYTITGFKKLSEDKKRRNI